MKHIRGEVGSVRPRTISRRGAIQKRNLLLSKHGRGVTESRSDVFFFQKGILIYDLIFGVFLSELLDKNLNRKPRTWRGIV